MMTLDQMEGSAWRAWNALKSLYCDLEFYSGIDPQERAEIKEAIREHLEFYASLCEQFDTTDALVDGSTRAMREIEEHKALGYRSYR